MIRSKPHKLHVVNMSWGRPKTRAERDVFLDHFQRLEALDAILVTSAGNDGSRERDLSSKLPTYLGTDGNALITVGGVETDGDLWPLTTPKKPGKPGSMTTYALAKGFWLYSNSGSQVFSKSGTSYGPPVVSGLAAYFGRHPIHKRQFVRGHVFVQMKRFLMDREVSPQLVRRITQSQYPGYPILNRLPVAYNLARGRFDCVAAQKRGEPNRDQWAVPMPSTGLDPEDCDQ